MISFSGRLPLLPCVFGAALSLGACSAEPQGPKLELNVSPLELPGVEDACYGIEVHNTTHAPGDPFPAGTLVWEKTGLCSTRYGDGGGAITYIGTCDASPLDPLNPAPRPNTVSLVLEGLCSESECALGEDDPGEIDPDTYQNPCPDTAPCELVRPCSENADTLVEFNLTIMRDATQGFFDIAVNFADIFCSAKLDCVGNLLHDDEGERASTVVLGFACTAGEGAESCLYLSDIKIDCTNDAFDGVVPVGGEPGNIDLPDDTSVLFGAALYQGDEQLPGLEKSFFNVALGLDEGDFAAAGDCNITWMGTASEGALDSRGEIYLTPEETAYPIVRWDRQILAGGAIACSTHPLNGADERATGGQDHSGVATEYTGFGEQVLFAHELCNEADDVPPGDPNSGKGPDDFTDLGTSAKGSIAANFLPGRQNDIVFTADHQLGVDTYADGIDARDCFRVATDSGEYMRYIVIPMGIDDELQVQLYTALGGPAALETYVASDGYDEYPGAYTDFAVSTFYPQQVQFACVSRTANSSATPSYIVAATSSENFPGSDTNNHVDTADSINGTNGNAPDDLTEAGAEISTADGDNGAIGSRLDQHDFYSFTFYPPSGGEDRFIASCDAITGVAYEVLDGTSGASLGTGSETLDIVLTPDARYYFVVHADPAFVDALTPYTCTLDAQ